MVEQAKVCILMLYVDKIKLFDHVLREHVTEAAFLWVLRDSAVKQVQQSQYHLNKLELRIIRHLQGLIAYPDLAWDLASAAASDNCDSGELFVLAVLAFMSADQRRVDQLLALGQQNPQAFSGLASALGCLPAAKVYPFLQPWITSSDTWLCQLAVVISSLRRLDPQTYLPPLLNPLGAPRAMPVVARALRLVGELKRLDLLALLKHWQSSDHPEVHFWSHWSALLLGDQASFGTFEPCLLQPGPLQWRAIELGMRVLPGERAQACVNQLFATNQQAQGLFALAALGDAGVIPWVIARMEDVAYAPFAGYVFSMITGVDGEAFARRQSSTQDVDDDAQATMPPGCQYLLPPEVKLVRQCWNKLAHQFIAGERYLAGRLIAPGLSAEGFGAVNQGLRQALALELALQNKQQVYANVRQFQCGTLPLAL